MTGLLLHFKMFSQIINHKEKSINAGMDGKVLSFEIVINIQTPGFFILYGYNYVFLTCQGQVFSGLS